MTASTHDRWRVLRQLARRTRVPALVRHVQANREWYKWRIAREVLPPIVPLYRWLLVRPVFVGITGSCGKSTTKELLGGIFAATLGKGSITPENYNQPEYLAATVLRTSPLAGYSVHEISVGKRGEPHIVPLSVRLIRPRIGVVTNIGDDHISAFGSREAIAHAKGELIAALPEDGVAVLNADDPLVLAMRSRTRARVLTYGRSPDATIRAVDVDSTWPDRLTFTAAYDGRSIRVTTQLCGEHWISAALAALAAALAAGIPLEAAARALASVPPFEARMQPHVRADGVTFVRDDAKAPFWTVGATLDFLRKARAPRKVLVLGTLSDHDLEHRTAYVRTTRAALDAVEQVIVIAPHAWNVLRLRQHAGDDRVHAFQTIEAAHRFLSATLRPGDLVLLKGHAADQLGKLVTAGIDPGAQAAPVAPSDAPSTAPSPTETARAAETQPPLAVVGLGNPVPEYAGTRHNVGQALVDRLARELDAPWTTVAGSAVAWTEWSGVPLCLVKPGAVMNESGPALKRVVDALGLAAPRTTLVHDEVDLPLGRIRGRAEGGDGGHRGVRSILQTFEDHRFRRVKLGIGRPREGSSFTDHVLGTFDAAEQDALAKTMDAGLRQVQVFLDEFVMADGLRQARPPRRGASAESATASPAGDGEQPAAAR